MSSGVNDGGPAFPSEQHERSDGLWNDTLERGMSLRDWFAGLAMQGMINDWEESEYHLACSSYRVADAMLKARENER